ncbi:MAG TPA: glycosyltransferase, partial [Actinotalea sp.]
TPQDRVRPSRPLRVLESFREPRPTTNPYVILLLRSLSGVEVRTFSWREALLGRYDVLHVHWPEVVVDRRNGVRAAGAALLFALVLLRCRLTRRAVVRTAHNLRPHEHPRWSTALALRLCDRSTSWWVRLNASTPTPTGSPATTILHGDYREWFADAPSAPSVPGRLLCFGLIRPYKGVERLLEAFTATTDPELSLRVVGRPSSAAVEQDVRAGAADDPRVSLLLDHASDEVLAEEVGQAELVVLPYRQMHNSGAVLLALSLGRPVLVASGEVTDALAEEVGQEWVLRYEGELAPEHLTDAVQRLRTTPRTAPDLSRRSWAELGAAHVEVFRAAYARVHGSGR